MSGDVVLRLQGIGIKENVSEGILSDLKGFDIFIDNYTCKIYDGLINRIERKTGKSVKIIKRSTLEEDAKIFVSKAKDRDVVLFIGGDPLIATTHKILYLEALNQRVELEICHSPSIFAAAVGESGLDFYRFGAVCTVAEWKPNYKPVSFYEKLAINFKNNFHTLILFDFDSDNAKSLALNKVLDILTNAEEYYKDNIINKETKLLVMMDLGTERKRFVFKYINELYSMSLNYDMACIILPAELTCLEEEILEAVCEFYDRTNL